MKLLFSVFEHSHDYNVAINEGWQKKNPNHSKFYQAIPNILIHDPFYWFSNHIFFLYYDNITPKDKLGMLGIWIFHNSTNLQSFNATIKLLSANPAKWSNTLKHLSAVPDNCLSVFDHFVGLVLKGLMKDKD